MDEKVPDDQLSQETETDVVQQHAETTEANEADRIAVPQINEPNGGVEFPDSIDAPSTNESITNGDTEDVFATANLQIQAADEEIRRLEADAESDTIQTTQPEVPDRPTTPLRDIPRINVEQPTPSLSVQPETNVVTDQDTTRSVHKRKVLSTSSLYFVKKTLDVILSSREGKKKGALRETATKTSELLQGPPPSGVDPNMIFEPLRLACVSQSVTVTTQALDCVGKLIAISFFDAPPPAISNSIDNDEESPVPKTRADAPTRPLMDRVIDTVCECFQGEGTDEKIQLQIIKALLSAVLDEQEGTMIHESSLLKAVRQTYNIFLLSRSTPTQSIAQGTLEQMMHAVFSRIKIDKSDGLEFGSSGELKSPHSLENGATPKTTNSDIDDSKTTTDEQPHERVTLDSFARRQSFDQLPDANVGFELILSREEVLVKDAFLIFRSMCKLSINKNLAAENASDLTSHNVRTKLLSLHMISTILNRHIPVFLSPKSMVRLSAKSAGIHLLRITKQPLCYALSQNSVSATPQVFQVSCEIFWRMVDSLRTHYKKEIEVFMVDIYLPILEMKTSSYQQKLTVLNVLGRLCADARALVEIYLNYDCDRSARDNIYER